jgi:NADP-dependent 3-hydroxy acid dehydrogenase YdfG
MQDSKTIIISITSDISLYLCNNVLKNHQIIGTYRKSNKELNQFKYNDKINLLKLDLTKQSNLKNFVRKNKKILNNWSNCIISIGAQKPIGMFKDLNSDQISESIDINFKNQIIILNLLLPLRKKREIKNVITWAGPGTNNANKLYFPYTISKIALIKSMELLDFEFQDVKFCILGPGWVKTKIHKETLANKKKAEKSYIVTKKILSGTLSIDTSMKDINDCVRWIFDSKKKDVGGRNFSVKHDEWKKLKFLDKIRKNHNNFKLRRKS